MSVRTQMKLRRLRQELRETPKNSHWHQTPMRLLRPESYGGYSLHCKDKLTAETVIEYFVQSMLSHNLGYLHIADIHAFTQSWTPFENDDNFYVYGWTSRSGNPYITFEAGDPRKGFRVFFPPVLNVVDAIGK